MHGDPKWEVYKKKVAGGGRERRAFIRVSKSKTQLVISPKARQDAGLKPGDRVDLMMDTYQKGFRPLLGVRKHKEGDWKIPKGTGFNAPGFIEHYKLKPGSYQAKVIDGVLQAQVEVLP